MDDNRVMRLATLAGLGFLIGSVIGISGFCRAQGQEPQLPYPNWYEEQTRLGGGMDMHVIQIEVRRVVRLLQIPEPSVRVVPDSAMLDSEMLGYTVFTPTPGAGGGGERCRITLAERARRRMDVLAHEVCHCANDRDVVGADGYLPFVTKRERAKREAAADVCAAGVGRPRQ